MGKCIYFVRHGQTIWNVENKICGATDIALTYEGHEQAKETGELIKRENIRADMILYSPLIRAKDTALHISEITGIPAKEEPRLIEQNFGKYESTPRNGEEFHEAKKEFLNRYEGGESMFHLGQRIYNLLDELKEDEKTYILVAHNGIARVVKSYFSEMTNEEYSSFGVPNCSINKFEWAEENTLEYGRTEELIKNDADKTGGIAPGLDRCNKVDKEYAFWGWQSRPVKPVLKGYEKIKDQRQLYDILENIWCANTCAARMRDKWCPENKTLGQCSITAFLVQDIFGGKVFGIPLPDGNMHCYNVIGDVKFDLTSEQFHGEVLNYEDNPEQFKEKHMKDEDKRARYEYIKKELMKFLERRE